MGAIIEFPRWRPPSISAQPRLAPGRRRRRRYDRSTPVIVGLVLIAACIFTLSLAFAATSRISVDARVIDGDTIENVETGERIRLANIDTPETGDRAQCAAERAAGERAKNEARALVSASTVTVIPTDRVDIYGRTIARVRVNGRDLGDILIERGLARPWRGRREPWCGADGSLLPAT